MEKNLTKEMKTEMLQGAMKFIAVQQGLSDLVEVLQETTPKVEYKKEAYVVNCMVGDKKIGEIYYSVRDGEFYFECISDSFDINPVLKIDDYTINIITVYLMSENLLA